MMEEAQDLHVVTLHRAVRAADLWSALEAAQYGHIVQQDEEGLPLSEEVDAFVSALTEVIEDWEAESTVQAGLMQKLDAVYSPLTENGSCVHWGVLHRQVELPEGGPVELPIALLLIGQRQEAELQVGLPRQLLAVGELPSGE